MKTKILLKSAVSVCSVLIVGIACDSNGQAGPPGRLSGTNQEQIIQLDASTKLTLLGVTHGGSQFPPGIKRFGGFNPIHGINDATVVWIKVEHEPGGWPSFELLVYDKANTACAHSEARSRSHVKDGVEVYGFVLDSFPRWDQEMILRVRPYQGAASKEHFVMTNPAPSALVADWTPKPLPDTQADGNLDVTLAKLVAGVPVPYREGRKRAPTNDPANLCVQLHFNFRENGQPTTNWHAWPVVTSDAAGNHARGLIYPYPTNGIFPSYSDRIHPSFPLHYDGYYYQSGLWPDEAAWKVKLEFIRESGFSGDEIVTFTNLAVNPGTRQEYEEQWTRDAKTNFTFVAQATVNGVRLKLLPLLLVPSSSQPGQNHISVIIYTDPDPVPQGTKLTVLQATDDQGREVWHPFSPAWAGHFSLEFPNPRDVKMLNLELALHKSRFVEFTVKPAKP